ncbi:predicted GPI-anchored protein 58 [Hyposmocoma kahamanoa]|uniref:predicted GPI-anchored protein 58 n=1 Tax=Hyposmocoma kahamanoa TaxID=1477025 RepID=UPI000E6D5F6E|nr:predicted GPI-anchored protein 58 [Hyposmocoma kahamanoa]
MMDARLGDIERRLPAESLRPPLGGRSSAPASEATPAATAIAAAAPRLVPSAAGPESIPGLSPARNAPTDPRPNKKAKRKAPPPKATAAPPAAPLAVPAVPAGPDMAASMPTDQAETPWSQVVGRKARKAKTAAAAIQAARAPAKAAPKTAPRPRALATPKSSAVVITLRPEAVAEKGVTYKGVLEAATAAIDLGRASASRTQAGPQREGVSPRSLPGDGGPTGGGCRLPVGGVVLRRGPCDGAPPHALLQVHGDWPHQSPLPV